MSGCDIARNFGEKGWNLGTGDKKGLDDGSDVQKEAHKAYWPYLAIVTVGLKSVDYVSV